MSQAPWTFGSPRSAFTPPPGLPMLPSSSCRMVNPRMPCTAVVCCVMPERVQDACRAGCFAIVSAICWICSAGMPVMRSPASSV